MADRIMDCLDPHFVRLMRNWAKATAGSSADYSMTSAYAGKVGSDGYDSTMPILRGEAVDVDVAFQAVDIPQRIAVQLYWLWERKSYRWLAMKAGCTHPTFVSRVMDGHLALRQELHRRRAKLGQIARVLQIT